MVAFDPPDIISRPLSEIVGRTKTVPVDFDLVRTARALGVTFGD
jgi:6-phosphofructokinase 1